MYGPISPETKAIGSSAAMTVKVARIVGAPGLRLPDTSGVDRALERVDRLTAVEHPAQLPAEVGIDEVVGQERCPQQLAQLDAGVVDRVSLGRRAEPGQRSHRAGMACLYRGRQMHQLVPMGFDQCRVNAGFAHGGDLLRDLHPSRHEQMALPQLAQPRAQIEAKQPRQRHREVGVAVRIDGELRDLDPLLSHDPFDGGAGLALVEHDRLGVEDPPAVAHMAVHADGGRLAPWILACLPYPPAGLQAHHVRRGQIGSAPCRCDGMALHELQHRLAGQGQTSLIASPAHGLADAGGRQLRDHARALGRRQAGAVREDAGVGHQQFLARSGLAPEHDPAEAHLGVHGQDDLGQLHLADALVKPAAQFGDFGVFFIGGQRRQMQLVIHAQRPRACGGGHGVDTGANACKQGCEEVAGPGRQLQPGVVAPGFGLPALVRDEQPLAAAEAQGVFDPHRAVAKGTAQCKQGGHLQCPERPLTVDVGDGLAPRRAQAHRRDLGRQDLGAGSVLGAQLGQRVEHRVGRRVAAGQPEAQRQQGRLARKHQQ